MAEAAGAAIVPGVVAFVVTRKLVGPGGSRELARLTRLSGADFGAPREGTLALLFRDWSPWLMALIVATFPAVSC